ncbi:hypothetical protein OPQ81_007285 [Rhizoctonia solani]|nr:hypothetical protein OPQ81_007285 [Rhizoctonia solani]
MRDAGMHERHVSSNSLFLPRSDPGPKLLQNLHVVTNILPSNGANTLIQGGSGVPFVQSPISSSLPPSPTLHGIPSIPRHKIVEITFDGARYVRVDLTRHLDGGAIRKDIISRFPSTAGSSSNLDIFRIHPPGSDAALNDWELMLDVGHFGDSHGSLKFLVRVADRYSDSHLPTYARAATTLSSPNHPYPIRFPSASPSTPSSRSSMADPGEWYGHNTPTPEAGAYTRPASHLWDGYPSGPVSMPTPMPATESMRQSTELGAPEFPSPDHSTSYISTPTFSGPTPENSSVQPSVRQSIFMNPPEFPPQFNNVTGTKRSRHISDYYGKELPHGSISDSHDAECRCIACSAGGRPNSVVIGNAMTTNEVLSHLYERGCRNVASELNPFTVSKDPVARGGGGDVYSGELRTGERVALKCVRLAIGNEDRNKLKRTAHELYVWSKCNHPNVLELIGVTCCRGQVAMVSPWLDHGDLPTFLRQNPGADRHNLCVQIADGVAYLHEQTIVHGDIKGANVLISRDHVAKITDFGTSALKYYTLEFAATKSKPGLSIRWAAPEILEDKSDNSYEADVYALGMTILEAVTGNIPYSNITKDCAVLRNIIQKILPARPEAHIPSGDYYGDLLWSLLSRCWAYEYRDRPTAIEVQHQIRTIVF